MEIVETRLPGLKIIRPKRFGDTRGFFSESYNRATLAEQGIKTEFVQDNHSFSGAIGTVRGLHCQLPPHAQIKLVRCGRGSFLDVAVDIRKGSPTYGQWEGVELSHENGRQLLVPEGFLHGFVTHQENTEIIYKCSDFYVPDCEAAVRFDDVDIGVNWGIETGQALVSEKDDEAGSLADLDNPFVFEPAEI